MPLDEDSGVAQFSTMNEMPLDNHLLAEKPGACGAPPVGASLERLANKDQVNTTEDGGTLDCARDKVWQACTGRVPDRAPVALTTPLLLPYLGLVIGRRPGVLFGP